MTSFSTLQFHRKFARAWRQLREAHFLLLGASNFFRSRPSRPVAYFQEADLLSGQFRFQSGFRAQTLSPCCQRMVYRCIRARHSAATFRLARNRAWRVHADSCADRNGQNPGGFSLVHQPADVRAAACGKPLPRPVHFSDQSSGRGRGAQPARSAGRHRAGRAATGVQFHQPSIPIRTGDTPPSSARASCAIRRTF